MSHNITIEGGTSKRLPVAGKYCDRDIVVTAEGVSLPTLDNPASEAEVFGGYEYIDGDGSKKSGTFTVEEEVNNLKSLTSELLTALDGKAAVGVETCTVVFLNNGADIEYAVLTYTAFENGEFTTKQVESPFEWSDEYGTEAVALENVVVNTSVSLAPFEYQFTCNNAEYWFVAETVASDVGFILYNFKVLGDATITVSSYYG